MDTVLAMALIAATNPVRLGIALLLLSRPRPMLNLLAFWLGATTMAITAGLGLLTLAHYFAPTFIQSVSAQAASSGARHAQIVVGLTILAVTALIAAGFSVRRSRVRVTSGAPSAGVMRTKRPDAVARLRGRVQEVLKGDYLSVAFVVGLGSGLPAVEYPVALAAIAASGHSVGVQFGAAIVFVIVMLLVVEIPLISYSAMPAHTHAFMLRLHDWVQPRRWRILVSIVAAEAVFMVVAGLGW